MTINPSMISLWETYAMAFSALEPHLSSHPTTTAALSGATAGGVQSLVAAPAENVRLVLEGGSGTGWSGAWKEVFRSTVPVSSTITQRENIRQVRDWMTEVKGMAGRGWDGWEWGCAKDVCGMYCSQMSSIYPHTLQVLPLSLQYLKSRVEWLPGQNLLRRMSSSFGNSNSEKVERCL
jgi:hypothetical protein